MHRFRRLKPVAVTNFLTIVRVYPLTVTPTGAFSLTRTHSYTLRLNQGGAGEHLVNTQIAYSTDDAAAVTGITKDAIRAAIATGKLRAKRQPLADGSPNPSPRGGKFVIQRADLVAWIDGFPDA